MTPEEAAAEITAKQELTVKTTEVVTEKEPVEFKKVTKKTDKLYVGQRKVKQKGSEGLKEVTKEVTKENGETIEENLIYEAVLKEPQTRIVLSGTKRQEEDAFTAAADVKQEGSGELTAPVSSMNVTSGFGTKMGENPSWDGLGNAFRCPYFRGRRGNGNFYRLFRELRESCKSGSWKWDDHLLRPLQ